MASLDVASLLCERVVSTLLSHIDAIMGQHNMAQRLLTTVTLLTSLSGVSASYNTSEVTLPGYGTFLGTTVSQTLTKKPLPRTVDAWLGSDYASQRAMDTRVTRIHWILRTRWMRRV
jgi:hypothetical protein